MENSKILSKIGLPDSAADFMNKLSNQANTQSFAYCSKVSQLNSIDDLEMNVYDQELQSCEGGNRSSAYSQGKCNEPGQGVH